MSNSPKMMASAGPGSNFARVALLGLLLQGGCSGSSSHGGTTAAGNTASSDAGQSSNVATSAGGAASTTSASTAGVESTATSLGGTTSSAVTTNTSTSTESTTATTTATNTTTGQGGATTTASTSAGGAQSSGGAGGTGGAVDEGRSADATFCKQQLDLAAEQYRGFLQTYTNPSQIPRSVDGGNARMVSASDWTSGFPAASLWLLFEHTSDDSFRTAAEAWTDALYGQRTRTEDHDVGFIIGLSYGNGYRLTGNTDYVAVLETAAQSLVSRFSSTVGAIRSWDFGSWQYPVIIDNMMNLELLFRASELSADNTFRDVAVSHADKTLANHFRSDASSYHVVDYDPATGNVLSKETNQGLSDESAWARGQAWGLYGFTMSYRETGSQSYLDQALAIADFYTGSDRMPDDHVPYFDFDAPIRDDVADYRDASAGAIATSALFELAGFAPDEARERYLDFAVQAVRSLSSDQYRAPLGENGDFLLMHSVGNYPISDEIDVAINYADYYYLEALLRCSRLE